MNFELEYTPEQEAFRREVRSLLEGCGLDELEFPVDSHNLSYDQYLKRRKIGRALGEKGWLWPTAPTQYGGGGLTIDHAIIIEEELGKAGLTLPPYYDSGGQLGGSVDTGVGERGAESALPTSNFQGGGADLAASDGARGRVRPGRGEDECESGRRRVRNQRREDFRRV